VHVAADGRVLIGLAPTGPGGEPEAGQLTVLSADGLAPLVTAPLVASPLLTFLIMPCLSRLFRNWLYPDAHR
jgi:hypothetical protein